MLKMKWEDEVKGIFASQAALWCWESDYLGEVMRGKILEGLEVYQTFLGETNPLTSHAKAAARDLQSQVASCISAHDPSLTPSDRDLHHSIPVGAQSVTVYK